MAKKPKLVIIDAHALIHRAYHALPPMRAKDGRPTGAAYGFSAMLLKVFSTLKPTHVVAAFDVKGPTFRHKEFKEYKAQRKKPEPDLIKQFETVREIVRAFNIPILQKQGFEADDIIGTLTSRLDDSVVKIVVTGDKDAYQLIDDQTSVFTLKRGISDTVLYNKQQVEEQFGFKPELVPDYKGLAGDPSDNIPGVGGIGDKTAKELISKYGKIEEIYENLDELPKRAQTCLKGQKKQALFSRKLATIKRDVPLDFELAQAELADYDSKVVMKLFMELGFRSLLARLPHSSGSDKQTTLFSGAVAKEEGEDDFKMPDNYHLAISKKEQLELRRELAKEKVIAFDTETDSLGARKWPIVGMSFAYRRGKKVEAWYVKVNSETVKDWKGFFEDKRVGKVGHNIKYDSQVLRMSGINLQPIVFDTKIASYLLQPEGAGQFHSLDNLAIQELGHQPISITSLIGKGSKDRQKMMSEVPLPEIARYAAEDAEMTWRLYELLKPRLKKEGLKTVFEQLELPLIEVLTKMELNGVKINKRKLASLQTKVNRRVVGLRQKIWRLAGDEFNVNSTQQLQVVLYEKLKLPVGDIKRTQTGYSTAASELVKLRDKHEIIVLLEEYRELNKLLNTYILTLPKLVDEKTGRVYGQFLQWVAATGRLSSANPNLQNIPARTSLGQSIRAAFEAERGNRLIKADYSQVELRLAAHLSKDEKMLSVFRNGGDIHRSTAAWVYGIEPSEVTKEQRRQAKTLNFGVLYGMGANSFAKAAAVELSEAKDFIERYRKQYEGLMNYIEEVLATARERGYVETLLGRKRYVPELKARAPGVQAQAERIAFNFPIQGTAADILKKAMIELDQCLENKYPTAKMILTVHDELVCEVKKTQAESLARDMKKIMEGVVTLDVPLEVDVSIGTNWRDLESTSERGENNKS